jgi:hypothetical protein
MIERCERIVRYHVGEQRRVRFAVTIAGPHEVPRTDEAKKKRQRRDLARLAHPQRAVSLLKAQFPDAEGGRDMAEAK